MAIRLSSTLLCDNSTDANFRAWAQFIEDTLVTTGGWVVTSDTGQTTPASLSHPTVSNTKQGYRIYRMNDSLQGTYPVFMRLDFGSGGNAFTPGMWVTIGTGSNGSGTITGLLWNGGLIAQPSVSAASNSPSQVTNSYGSADTNRFSFGLWVNSVSQSLPTVFTLERTKDVNGNDTGDGLLLVYKDGLLGIASACVTTSRYIYYPGGVQPTAEIGLSYVITRQNPSETFGGDIGVGIVIHFRGVSQQPGANVMIVNSNDVSAEGSINLTLYGATRTYQHMNFAAVEKALTGTVAADNNARAMIRYD